MLKLIFKTIAFIFPWTFLFVFNYNYLEFYSGDLLRMSYSYKSPKNKAITNFPTSQKKHININSYSPKEKKVIDILSIGDSFSDIENSYTDFLSSFGYTVIHVGRTDGINSNPFQKCIDLINTGIVKKMNPKIILIETVERELFNRINELNYNSKPEISNYISNTKNQTNPNTDVKIKNEYNEFVLRSVLKAPKAHFFYNILETKPDDISVCMAKLKNNNQFKPQSNSLLFLEDDIANFKFESTLIKQIIESTEKFNTFCKKHNIKVFYLIAPDKYDAYFKEIKNSEIYKESLFFQFWNEKRLKLNIIDACKIINQLKQKNNSNLYHFGDTHWTSIVTEEIAKELHLKLQIK
jgi:hypothetical protein